MFSEQIVLNVNVFVLNFKGDLIQMYDEKESICPPNSKYLYSKRTLNIETENDLFLCDILG